MESDAASLLGPNKTKQNKKLHRNINNHLKSERADRLRSVRCDPDPFGVKTEKLYKSSKVGEGNSNRENRLIIIINIIR